MSNDKPTTTEMRDAFVDFMVDHSNEPLTFHGAEEAFEAWYRDARQDARSQVIEWFHEHIGGLWPSVIDEARERFEIPNPAAVLVPAQEDK